MNSIAAALAGLERGVEHDLLQLVHLVGAEGERAVGAHLHAGPAIVVMRGGDHRDAGHVEIELREIGHRRQRKPDVAHPHAGRHHAGDQRHLHRGRIAAEIMPGDDVGLHAHLVHQRADAHAEPLHAHQVDLFAEQPACVIFAKAGRLHHRLGIHRRRYWAQAAPQASETCDFLGKGTDSGAGAIAQTPRTRKWLRCGHIRERCEGAKSQFSSTSLPLEYSNRFSRVR